MSDGKKIKPGTKAWTKMFTPTKQSRKEESDHRKSMLSGTAQIKAARQFSRMPLPQYRDIRKELDTYLAEPNARNGDIQTVQSNLLTLHVIRLVLMRRLDKARDCEDLQNEDQVESEIAELDALISGVKVVRKPREFKRFKIRSSGLDGFNVKRGGQADVRAEKVKLRFDELRDDKSKKYLSVKQIRERLADEFGVSSGTIYNDLRRKKQK